MGSHGFKECFLNIVAAEDEQIPSDYFTIYQLPKRSVRVLSSSICKKIDTDIGTSIAEQDYNDIPTLALCQLQNVCIRSMEVTLDLSETTLSAKNSLSLLHDILWSNRLVLQMVLWKPGNLIFCSEEVLRSILGVLISIPVGTCEKAQLGAISRIREELAINLKILSNVACKINLHVALPKVEELTRRMMHPMYGASIPQGVQVDIDCLAEAAMQLSSTIFLQYSDERPALIAMAVSIAMADAQRIRTSVIKSRREYAGISSLLFVTFVHLCVSTPRISHHVSHRDVLDEQEGIVTCAESNIRRHTNQDEVATWVEAAVNCAHHIISKLLVVDGGTQERYFTVRMVCEDLAVLVRSPQGAGAEVILRCLLGHILSTQEDIKCQWYDTSLASQLLEIIGETISGIYALVQERAMTEEASTIECSPNSYWTVIKHLQKAPIVVGAARAYLIAIYAQHTFAHNHATDVQMEDCQRWLEEVGNKSCLLDAVSLSDQRPQRPSKQSVEAYHATLVTTELFLALKKILSTLREGLENRSLIIRMHCWKAFIGICGKNPRILSQTRGLVSSCLNDPSARVREAAVVSLKKYKEWRTSLLEHASKGVVDMSPAVRKHFLRILEDSHVAQGGDFRFAACLILHMTLDGNVSVASTARKVLERLWLPWLPNDLYKANHDYVIGSLGYIIQEHPSLEMHLCHFFAQKKEAKQLKSCQLLVKAVLQRTTRTMDVGVQECQMLSILSVFAKADGCLFAEPPYDLFQSYLTTEGFEERKPSFDYVASIFMQVSQSNSSCNTEILCQLQDVLLRLLARCRSDADMDRVTSCLWRVSDMLKKYSRLCKPLASLSRHIVKNKENDENVHGRAATQAKAGRAIRLLGFVGQNFFAHGEKILVKDQVKFSYPKPMLEVLVEVFNERRTPMQYLALQSMCRFCHTWPSYLVEKEIYLIFREILEGTEENHQIVVIEALLQFLSLREQVAARIDRTEDLSSDGYSLLDQVVHQSAERYLPRLLSLAMQGQHRRTLAIAKYIVSVSKQGLVSPNKVYSTLVTLGTSVHTDIANPTNAEHKRIHDTTRSAVESSYDEALRKSFVYQRDIVEDPSGIWASTRCAKLWTMFQSVDRGGKRSRPCFSQICSELETTIQHAQDALYVKYIAENLAFCAYKSLKGLEVSIFNMQRITEAHQPTILHDMQAILDKTVGQQGRAGLSHEDHSSPIQQLGVRYVTASTVWEVCRFLEALRMVSNNGDIPRAALLRFHDGRGGELLESIASRYLCLNDHSTLLAHGRHCIVNGFDLPQCFEPTLE